MKLPIISNLFGSKREEVYLGLVLGSHAVKATVFTPPSQLGLHPKILGRSTQKQGLTSMRGAQILDLDATLETAGLAIEQVGLASGQNVSRTILGLFGGSVRAVGLTVRLRRPQAKTQINQKELAFLLEKVREKTIPTASQEIARNNYPPTKLEHLNTFLTQYKLDNKVVTTPVGLPGEVFEAALIHTFAQKQDLQTFKLFAKELGLKVLSFLSSSLIWTLPLLAKHAEGVLIDIGGEATEVVLFKNGRLIGNGAFALGGQTLTELIGQKLNTSFDQAEEIKLKYAASLLDQERSGVVREAVSEGLSFWVRGLESFFKEFPRVNPLPSLFLLTGGAAPLAEVKSSLLTYPWDKKLTLSTFPRVEKLDESIIYQGFNYVQTLL